MNIFQHIFEVNWAENVASKPKLRTYLQIKHTFGAEPYATCRLARSQRSLMAQLRFGILPLAIEVGRYHNTSEDDRLCEMCDLNEIENEVHFILYCPYYDDLRIAWFQRVLNKDPAVFWYTDIKLEWLFNHDPFGCASYVSKAWTRRMDALFNGPK